jgi:hypothetical protein
MGSASIRGRVMGLLMELTSHLIQTPRPVTRTAA